MHRTNVGGGTLAPRFNGSGFTVNDAITSPDATGFTVSRAATTSNSQNVDGEVYYYLAWNQAAGQMMVNTCAGNATDNRNVVGLGFQPAGFQVGTDPDVNDNTAACGGPSCNYN